jgi:hypothetical protein
LLSTSYKISSNILPARLTPYAAEITADHQCGFGVTDQRAMKFSIFGRYWRKKWEYNCTIHQLFIDFKKAYNSVRREVLYNILIQFGIPRKLVGLIQMCLNKTYSTVHIGKYKSDKFPIQMA